MRRRRCELLLDLCGDTSRNFVLQGHQVAHVPFVRLSPDVLIGCGAHQLGSDTDPISGAKHRTFNDAIDTEFLGDLGSLLCESLYCMIEVREMTLRPGILAKSVATKLPSCRRQNTPARGQRRDSAGATQLATVRAGSRHDGVASKLAASSSKPSVRARMRQWRRSSREAMPGTDAFRNSAFRDRRRRLWAGRWT